MYSSDYDDVLPGATNGPGGSGTYGGWTWYATFGAPTAGYFDVSKGAIFPYTRNGQVFMCPEDTSRSGCSYEVNSYLRWLPAALLPKPAETLLLIPEDASGTANDGYFDVAAGDIACAHHNGGMNFAFCDGHVKWNRWEKAQVYSACWP
jgi:prepilin-type processing-associated H-X9-DG protein